MTVVRLIHDVFGSVGYTALGLFVGLVSVGVLCFLVYVARAKPNPERIGVINRRLFQAAIVLFYVGFFCLLIHRLTG